MMKQNDTINKVAELLDRFLQGQTSEAEEQQLTDYFCHADHIPEKWSLYKELFQSFRTEAYDFAPEEVELLLTDSVAEQCIRPISSRHPWRIAVRIAAAACLLAVISLVAFRPWTSSEEEPSPQVAQEITVGELLETLTILAEATPEDATITATPSTIGIKISTTTPRGKSATYTLKRRTDNTTLEMTSQLIHK